MAYFPYDVARLFIAYSAGEFPTMPEVGAEYMLYRPQRRAVLPIGGLHMSGNLVRALRKQTFTVTMDEAFDDVVQACVRPEDNWITPEYARIYGWIHRDGWAHSVECWQDDELAGGLYGIAIGGAFFIESMFTRKRDASKVATKVLLDELSEQGFKVVDLMMMSEHLASLGAVELTDEAFRRDLRGALDLTTRWGQSRSLIGGRLSPPTLHTDRLVLRGFDVADAPAYLRYNGNPMVSRYTLVHPPRTLKEAEAWITGHCFERYRTGVPDPLAICLRDDPATVIGSIGCFRSTPMSTCMELAYDLDQAYWGRGLVHEAAVKVVDHVFATCAIERLQTRSVAENANSEKVTRKLGFRYEGTLRRAMYHAGRFWDMRYHAIMRDEWAARRDAASQLHLDAPDHALLG